MKWRCIAPGRPMDDGGCDFSNRRVRDGLLNATLFFGIDHARAAVARRSCICDTAGSAFRDRIPSPTVFSDEFNAVRKQFRASEPLRRPPIAP